MFALCFRISEILIIKKMTDPGRQKKSETNNNGTSLKIQFSFAIIKNSFGRIMLFMRVFSFGFIPSVFENLVLIEFLFQTGYQVVDPKIYCL